MYLTDIATSHSAGCDRLPQYLWLRYTSCQDWYHRAVTSYMLQLSAVPRMRHASILKQQASCIGQQVRNPLFTTVDAELPLLREQHSWLSSFLLQAYNNRYKVSSSGNVKRRHASKFTTSPVPRRGGAGGGAVSAMHAAWATTPRAGQLWTPTGAARGACKQTLAEAAALLRRRPQAGPASCASVPGSWAEMSCSNAG